MADPATPYQLPIQPRVAPWRDMVRGAVGVAEAIPTLVNAPIEAVRGLVQAGTGYRMPYTLTERAGQALSRGIDEVVGANAANPLDETERFGYQLLGGSVVGIPRAGMQAIGAAVPGLARALMPTTTAGRIGMGVAEAVTPVTLPLTPARVAANVVGGGAIGTAAAGLERLGEVNALDDPDITGAAAPASNALQEPTATPPVTAPEVNWGRALGGVALSGLLAFGAYKGARYRMDTAAALSDGTVRPGPDPGEPDAWRPSPSVQAENFAVDRSAATRQAVRDTELPPQLRLGSTNDDYVTNMENVARMVGNPIQRRETAMAALLQGELPDGTRIVPMRQLADEVAQMEPANRAAFLEAVTINTELDNRIRNAMRGDVTKMPNAMRSGDFNVLAQRMERDGRIPQGIARTMQYGEGERTSFTDLSTADLYSRLYAAQNAPGVKQLMVKTNSISDGLLNFSVAYGRLSASEAGRIKAQNPHWLHQTLAHDADKSPLSRRDIGEGRGNQYGQDPLEAMTYAVQRVVDDALKNKGVRDLANHFDKWQNSQQGPKMPRFVGKVLAPDAKTKRETIKYYDGGKLVQREVYVPEIAALINSNPYAAKSLMDQALNSTRQLMQFFTTGPGSALSGAFFAPTSAAFSTTAALVNRPKGRAFGYIDKALQDRGLPGLRGDPTAVVSVLNAMVRDTGSVMARELSATLQRSLSNNTWLVNAIGRQNVKQYADMLAKAYENSMWHKQMVLGSSNAGLSEAASFGSELATPLAAISPTYAAGQPISMFIKGRNGAPVINPALNDIDSWKAAIGDVANSATPASVRRAFQLTKQINDIIAGAPSSAMFRTNYSDSMTQRQKQNLAMDARTVSGDPSQVGANEGVASIARAVPYGNNMVQGIGKMVQAFNKNPVGTTTAILTMATVPTMIQFVSAIKADEERIEEGLPPIYVQDMLRRPLNESVGAWRIYMNGVLPDNTVTIPFDQNLSPFVAMMQVLLPTMTGATDLRFFSPEMTRSREAFASFLEQRNVSMATAGAQRFASVSPPPLVQAGGSLFDLDLRNMLNPMDPRITSRAPGGAAGYERNALPDDVIDKHVAEVFRAMLGTTGEAIVQFTRDFGFTHKAAVSDPLGAGARAVMDRVGMNAADRTRMLAPLWSTEQRATVQDSLGSQVRAAEQKLTEVAQGFGDVTRPDTVGSGRQLRQSETGGGRAGVPDDMRPVLMQLNKLHRDIQPMAAERKRIRDEIAGVERNGGYSPSDKRQITNNLVRAISRVDERMHTMISEREAYLSQQLGRRVRVHQVDPSRGLDQFVPLVSTPSGQQ